MEEKKHITLKIIEELDEIQQFLESVPEGDDPSVLIERLTMLNAYMARTGFLMAEAKADQDAAIAGVVAEHSKQILQMPATGSQKFINALCKDENYYATLIERIHRTCVHQGDNIRTQISFAKEDLSLTRRGY